VVITAAGSKVAQQQALSMAALRGRVGLFGGVPPTNPVVELDTNLIHYRELSALRVESLTRSSRSVDARSILGVLTLDAARGHRIRLTIDGPDEVEALADLVAFIGDGLGE
jgi:phosphotransferase system HPr (HPr) family protein